MVGYPYYSDYSDCSDDTVMLSNTFVDYSHVIFLTLFIALFSSVNPALAVDTAGALATSSNSTKTKTVASIALLGAIDAASCAKGTQCIANAKTQLAEKVVKQPKIATAIVCTAAIVWCARGVAERVVNQHL